MEVESGKLKNKGIIHTKNYAQQLFKKYCNNYKGMLKIAH